MQVNIPIQICQENKIFESQFQMIRDELNLSSDTNLSIELVSIPEGTGRMMDLLESFNIDMALTVTGNIMITVIFSR